MHSKIVEWVLRVALAGEFLGHGIFALQLKKRFLEMLTAFIGVSGDTATTLLKTIGAIDILVAIVVIIKPFRIVLLYAAVWGFLTALARPIAGDPIWDFVERWANIGVPLALLFIKGWPKHAKEWFA